MASSSSSSGSEDPTEKLKKEPSKGILKPSVSYEEKDKKNKMAKSAKWDEMNILKTLHPLDKDYGHMKVDEPKTPFEREIPESNDDMDGGVNAEELRKRIEEGGRRRSSSFQSEEESDDDEDESPENKIAREVFERKRKEHYNEFQTAKILAKQMMDEEDEDDNDNDNKPNVDDRV
ncbi:Hypothetical protein CINCED_3A001896 [Cinara cedri]|uniref:Protein phosphatase inhibitor 2 (IPP-2) n=1 Tax=Cinara cedri TaxID=506608 RepID=A0A5E4N344_9HEMI|nr:Hypothetical protein CINCED_3A001896 [Cinara cedri]